MLGESSSQFRHLLERNQVVISGSFLLQCLLGQTWTGSDLDLYLDDNQDHALETFLQTELPGVPCQELPVSHVKSLVIGYANHVRTTLLNISYPMELAYK